MKSAVVLLVILANAVLASPSNACFVPPEYRTNFQIRMDSLPVQVTTSCGFVNGGVNDSLSAANAEDLGSGRVMQLVNNTDHIALLADCATREVTMLRSSFTLGEGTDCGPNAYFDPLVGPDAIVSLSAGETLQELVLLAEQRGAAEWNPVEYFNTDPWGDQVWRRDHVNLLCGCQLYYPDSPGATQ